MGWTRGIFYMLSTFTKIEYKLSLNLFLFKWNCYYWKARYLNYNFNIALYKYVYTFSESILDKSCHDVYRIWVIATLNCSCCTYTVEYRMMKKYIGIRFWNIEKNSVAVLILLSLFTKINK